ncbi:hypothetical protein GCM10023074_34850 [Microbispora amethystogenes]|uniref:Lipoprotein n=1 Tax=Microbispora amethystogenes TaxID=1427754 RepID=A0ABQ4FAU2_9ACTN|nr:hypothetical protein Mam01_21030 [Microbispora amethystogenes]
MLALVGACGDNGGDHAYERVSLKDRASSTACAMSSPSALPSLLATVAQSSDFRSRFPAAADGDLFAPAGHRPTAILCHREGSTRTLSE